MEVSQLHPPAVSRDSAALTITIHRFHFSWGGTKHLSFPVNYTDLGSLSTMEKICGWVTESAWLAYNSELKPSIFIISTRFGRKIFATKQEAMCLEIYVTSDI